MANIIPSVPRTPNPPGMRIPLRRLEEMHGIEVNLPCRHYVFPAIVILDRVFDFVCWLQVLRRNPLNNIVSQILS
jgi:hypothetical protein